MKALPFSQKDWQRVQDASHAVLNATLADDAELYRTTFAKLVAVLEQLRVRYGDHPILRETEADFLDDPSRQLTAYRCAIQLAEQNALPTLSIRISLAGVLINDFADRKQAARELAACESELAHSTDEYEKRQWHELMSQCQEAPEPGGPR